MSSTKSSVTSVTSVTIDVIDGQPKSNAAYLGELPFESLRNKLRIAALALDGTTSKSTVFAISKWEIDALLKVVDAEFVSRRDARLAMVRKKKRGID